LPDLSLHHRGFDGITDIRLFGSWKDNDNVTLTFTKDF
jgi:hypothetical protein